VLLDAKRLAMCPALRIIHCYADADLKRVL